MFNTKAVSGLYDTYELASETVGELELAGFGSDNITLVTNHPGAHDKLRLGAAERTADFDAEEKAEAEKGVLGGLMGGGAVGLLAGLGLVAVPGIGIVVAGGWLVATAIGASLGAAGGLSAALVQCGHLDEHAASYEEAVKAGGTLVTVRCTADTMHEARQILERRASAALPVQTARAA